MLGAMADQPLAVASPVSRIQTRPNLDTKIEGADLLGRIADPARHALCNSTKLLSTYLLT